jgi:transcriptional regulator with XRE-family HTH domain
MRVMDETRTDFVDLVRDRRRELRLSYAAVEERMPPDLSGEGVSGSWLHRLEKGERVRPPHLGQLHALSVALDLPLHRLQEAAGAQFLGIDTVWSSSGEARALVERADRLTPEARAQLLRLIDTLTAEPGEN